MVSPFFLCIPKGRPWAFEKDVRSTKTIGNGLQTGLGNSEPYEREPFYNSVEWVLVHDLLTFQRSTHGSFFTNYFC